MSCEAAMKLMATQTGNAHHRPDPFGMVKGVPDGKV
jgi:hypothetical protein